MKVKENKEIKYAILFHNQSFQYSISRQINNVLIKVKKDIIYARFIIKIIF